MKEDDKEYIEYIEDESGYIELYENNEILRLHGTLKISQKKVKEIMKGIENER